MKIGSFITSLFGVKVEVKSLDINENETGLQNIGPLLYMMALLTLPWLIDSVEKLFYNLGCK